MWSGNRFITDLRWDSLAEIRLDVNLLLSHYQEKCCVLLKKFYGEKKKNGISLMNRNLRK